MNTDPPPTPGSVQWEAIQAQAHAWARELSNGRPSRADGEAFRTWRAQSPAHERAWVQACREWRKLGAIVSAYEAQRPAPAARLALRARRVDRRVFFGTALSAVGALAVVGMVRPPLGLWPSWSELGADYRTAAGEQRDVELAGNVRLFLNTRTSVAIHSDAGRARIALIAGEAAVSAGQGAGCDVVAGSGRVRLTDGDIEIRRLASGQVRVRCNAGEAQVWHSAGTVTLQARQRLFYDERHLEPPANMAQAESDWRHGVVVFRDLPLTDAIEEINRYRAGRVVLMNDALALRRLSGRFEVNALDEAIVHIQKLYQAEVRRVGDLVLLS